MTDSIKAAMARSLTNLRERTEDPAIRSMIDDVVDGKSSLRDLLGNSAFNTAFPVPTQVTAADAETDADADDFSAQTYLRRR